MPAAPLEYSTLVGALRRLLDVATDARGLDAPTLARATGALERATADLEAARADLDTGTRRPEYDGQRAPMPEWEYEQRDDAFVARATFSVAHEGPPGTVHGGYVAFAFDEVLGWATARAGYPAMTGRLTVRYRRPTPLGVPIEVTVPWPRVTGKRIRMHATLDAGGEVTAEAEGLFVRFELSDGSSRAQEG
ncbi:MAG TPA: PaaI family thioesterase [Acidimicrobiia bacterium]